MKSNYKLFQYIYSINKPKVFKFVKVANVSLKYLIPAYVI